MNAGNRSRRWWPGLLVCALLWQPGFAVAEGRFTISPDGTQVTDSQTGLTWRRCSEGQTFSAGTCTNPATAFTHQAALVHARTQTGWRLPNVKELSSIVAHDRHLPAIDLTVFPATPSTHYWSSSPSPYGGYAAYAWVVNFYGASVDSHSRNLNYQVRLVR